MDRIIHRQRKKWEEMGKSQSYGNLANVLDESVFVDSVANDYYLTLMSKWRHSLLNPFDNVYINFSYMYKVIISVNFVFTLNIFYLDQWKVRCFILKIIGVCFLKVCVHFNLIRRSIQRVHFWTPGQTRSYNLTCACADCCYYHWLEVRPTWKLLSICHASHVCRLCTWPNTCFWDWVNLGEVYCSAGELECFAPLAKTLFILQCEH